MMKHIYTHKSTEVLRLKRVPIIMQENSISFFPRHNFMNDCLSYQFRNVMNQKDGLHRFL